MTPRTELLAGLGLWVLIGLTLMLYWPGLPGPFMLDDVPNLIGLEQVRQLSQVDRMLQWVLMGSAGPLGRPISLATFLLNDYTWPTDAASFRYTNLCIHVLTGTLLYWLILSLLTAIDVRHAVATFVALATTALWLIHPLNVFTVLYVVQRMTELSALFVVAGLLAYTKGRLLAGRRPLAAYVLMTLGIACGGVLGVFSKENAVLIVLFALVIEIAVMRAGKVPRPRAWHLWATPMLYAPTALVTFFLLRFPFNSGAFSARPFTLSERLLTEPRVLLDYLGTILLPRRPGTGLFHDDFALSTDLFSPPTTLFAIAALFALVLVALAALKKAPILAFGIFWFLAGHLLEGTFVPLELYFEHRNYLPMVGPLFALSYYTLIGIRQLPRILAPALCLYIGLTGMVAWQQVQLWTQPLLMADVWADEHPSSGRAQQFAADRWMRAGRPDVAEKRLRHLAQANPQQSSVWVQLVWVNCLTGRSFAELDADQIITGIQTGVEDSAVGDTIEKMIQYHEKHACPGLEYSDLERMLDAAIRNPAFRRNHKRLAQLHFFKSKLYAAQRTLDPTVRSLRRAFEIDPRVEYPLIEARILASARLYKDALEALDRARQVDRHTLLDVPLKSDEIRNLEHLIRTVQNRYKEKTRDDEQ